MDDEAFDQLIDDATHAVNNLIPDKDLGTLGRDAHSDFLVRINEALVPVSVTWCRSMSKP